MKKLNEVLLLAGLLGLLFVSCKQGENRQVVDLHIQVQDAKEWPLSTIAGSVDYVRLETADSVLIGRIKQIFMTSEDIFIVPLQQEMLRFGKDGQYKGKIGSVGKGPHEYNFISGATTDGQYVYLLVPPVRLMKFDPAGNFIEQIDLKEKWGAGGQFDAPVEVTYYDGMFYFMKMKLFMPAADGGFDNSTQVLVADKNFVLKDSLLVKSYTIPSMAVTFPGTPSYFSAYDGNLCIFPASISPDANITDTLFVYHRGKLGGLAVFHFDGVEKNERGEAKLWLRCLSASPRFLFADYGNTFCYDRKTGESYNALKGFTDDFYHTGEVLLRPCMDGRYFFVKNGYELDGKIEGVSEDSNPVLFMVKLKE